MGDRFALDGDPDELAVTSWRTLGMPAPQFGMKSVNTAAGPRLKTDGGVGLLPWRSALATDAEIARVTGRRHAGPVALDIEFRFPMPATRLKREREAGQIPKWRRPDLDKLLRAVCDALTVGGLILDDAQIAEIHARKREYWDSWSGADITVRDLWTP